MPAGDLRIGEDVDEAKVPIDVEIAARFKREVVWQVKSNSALGLVGVLEAGLQRHVTKPREWNRKGRGPGAKPPSNEDVRDFVRVKRRSSAWIDRRVPEATGAPHIRADAERKIQPRDQRQICIDERASDDSSILLREFTVTWGRYARDRRQLTDFAGFGAIRRTEEALEVPTDPDLHFGGTVGRPEPRSKPMNVRARVGDRAERSIFDIGEVVSVEHRSDEVPFLELSDEAGFSPVKLEVEAEPFLGIAGVEDRIVPAAKRDHLEA